jgi:hypothetical protein
VGLQSTEQGLQLNRVRPRWTESVAVQVLILALLCILAYAPSLSIPLIEDDYPNILQARVYGPVSGLPALFHDAVFRLRAVNYWAFFVTWKTFGLAPWAYHLLSLLLHVANAFLVYRLASAWPRMRSAAFWAAAFFAIQERHQEAVMWASAINELFQFLFGIGALLCWIAASKRNREWMFQTAGIFLFALALLSKESAVIFLPLFLLTVPFADWRRSLLRLIPYLILAGLAVSSIISTRNYSFRFTDGSFSIHAPFVMTWLRNVARTLWIWGWLAGAYLISQGDREPRSAAYFALAWIGCGLVPYSFLTYSHQIPSRQMYLASAGLALIVGLAVARLWGEFPQRKAALAMVLFVVLAANIGILWVRKREAFLRRAAPTERLIALARKTGGPIWVRCFPRPPIVAEAALQLTLGLPPSALIWSEKELAGRRPASVFCYEKR